jgi:hypothetical protein
LLGRFEDTPFWRSGYRWRDTVNIYPIAWAGVDWICLVANPEFSWFLWAMTPCDLWIMTKVSGYRFVSFIRVFYHTRSRIADGSQLYLREICLCVCIPTVCWNVTAFNWTLLEPCRTNLRIKKHSATGTHETPNNNSLVFVKSLYVTRCQNLRSLV